MMKFKKNFCISCFLDAVTFSHSAVISKTFLHLSSEQITRVENSPTLPEAGKQMKGKKTVFTAFTAHSDEDILSSYNIITVPSRKVMRIKKNIN